MPRSSRAVRVAAGCAVLLVLCSGQIVAQQASVCPACADATALIKRFELTEAPGAVRERPGWSPPRKIVTMGGEVMAVQLRAAAPGATVITVENPQAALAALPGADVYVGSCTPAIVQTGTSLKWIHLVSAGADACAAVPAVTERAILLTNSQGIFAPQVADQAMALLLSLTRRLPQYHNQQQSKTWSHPVADPRIALDSGYWELEGKALLVLGLGGIGTEVAKRGHAFGMRVRGTRTSSRDGPPFVEYVGLSNETVQLARWADVVVNVLPVTSETRGTINREFFQAMKPSSYFINIGRGETVVTADLVQALQSGRLAGAGLDVTAPEPLPPDHPLWSMPNVVLTPHTAGASDQVLRRSALLAAENLRRYVSGDRMLSVVNPRRGY